MGQISGKCGTSSTHTHAQVSAKVSRGHESYWICANGLSLAAHPCEEGAAGQSSRSAKAEASDSRKSNSTQSFSSADLLRQWLAMLCKIALMPQRGSGLPLANLRAVRAATESSAKPCLPARINETYLQATR